MYIQGINQKNEFIESFSFIIENYVNDDFKYFNVLQACLKFNEYMINRKDRF